MSGDRSVPQGPAGREGWTPELSGWLLATLAILLGVVLLAIGGATLYLVGKTNDQIAKYQATQRAVTASQDLLKVHLARQVRDQAKDQDIQGRVQTAVNQTKALLGETEQVLIETTQVLAPHTAPPAHGAVSPPSHARLPEPTQSPRLTAPGP